MNRPATDYVRTHDLARKYGFGALFVAFMAIGTAILGNPASVVGLKTIAAIPLAIAMVTLPAIFNPERSRTPFMPSFIERTALEGVLIAVGVAIFSWAPDHSPVRLAIVTIMTAALYLGLICLLAKYRQRPR